MLNYKCEYVDGLEVELAGMRRNHQRLLDAFEAAYAQASRAGELRAGSKPAALATATLMFLNGMVRLWLLDTGRRGARARAREAIRAHVRSVRA